MRWVVLAVERPGDGLADRPAAGTLTVEPELRGQSVEAVEDVTPGMAELERADDRRDSELALAGQRLRVDREPRLALGAEGVFAGQGLGEQPLLAPRAG